MGRIGAMADSMLGVLEGAVGMSTDKAPRDAFEYLYQGLTLNKLGRHDEGFGYLNRAVALARKDAKAADEAARAGGAAAGGPEGDAKRLKGAAVAARKELRAAVMLAHAGKGVALSHIGRYKKAVPYFKRALKLDPKNGASHYLMGCALDNAEAPLLSVKHFDRALRLGCRELRVYQRKARALNNCDKPREAIGCVREALRVDSGYADAHFEMGSSYALMGNLRRTIKCCKRAIAADPRHKEAHEYLGIAYTTTRRYGLARTHLERALELAPGDPDVLESLDILSDRVATGRAAGR